MTRKLSSKEYIDRVYETVGEEYSILEEYVDTRTKLLTRHNICANEWMLSPNKFLMGRRCPKCSRKNLPQHQPLSTEKLNRRVSDTSNGTVVIIEGEYLGNDTKMLFGCLICENTFYQKVSTFLSRKRCPHCNKKNNVQYNKKSHGVFEEEMTNKYGNEYEILGNYIDAKTHILLRHSCGHEWFVTPSNILRGFGCPPCGVLSRSNKARKQVSLFVEEINDISNGEYILVSDYLNNRTKVKLKHLSCGTIWDIIPSNVLKGRGCPRCKTKSLGEKRIRSFLENNNIKYKKEKSFPDCLSGKLWKLRFDFAIYDEDYIVALIEYQGIGHFISIEYFGGDDSFIERQINDSYKKYYCNKKYLALITINYDQYENIEDILSYELDFLLEGR